ncbi:glycosyltransferase family 2 protein [Candidatus Daviesbacteria bacterium]|nr:glycosyltransferase family 2 protein [Candidatus Daviesbacteria bacterium]
MKNSVEKLSISIVNYNAGEHILNCLNSLEHSTGGIELDIWIVDNNSEDESVEKIRKHFPGVHITSNKENVGFGKAHNQNLRKIKTELILILNPDTVVLPGTIDFMVQFMKNNMEVGAATCRIEKSNGSLDEASHRGFPTPWASFLYYFLKNDSLYHLTKKDMNKAHEVDAISGAFFLTRKKVLDEVGLFDEDFFLYAEDIDLCFRIKQAGFKIMYIPDVKAVHLKGISSGIKSATFRISAATSESRSRAFNSFYSTMLLFYKKHLEQSYPFFINWLVYAGIRLKWWLAKRKLVV